MLCFSKYYKKLIKNIFFVDTPLLEKYMLKFENMRGNINWIKKIYKNNFSWNKKDKNNNRINLQRIDAYNFEIKHLIFY